MLFAAIGYTGSVSILVLAYPIHMFVYFYFTLLGLFYILFKDKFDEGAIVL